MLFALAACAASDDNPDLAALEARIATLETALAASGAALEAVESDVAQIAVPDAYTDAMAVAAVQNPDPVTDCASTLVPPSGIHLGPRDRPRDRAHREPRDRHFYAWHEDDTTVLPVHRDPRARCRAALPGRLA